MKRRDVLLAALGLAIVWQIAAMLVNRPILPAPWEVLVVFAKELGNGLLIHFGVSLWCVRDWLARPNLEPQQKDVPRQRKLDKDKLRLHVRDNPEATLRERASYFGVRINSMGWALHRLKLTHKKRRSSTKSVTRTSA